MAEGTRAHLTESIAHLREESQKLREEQERQREVLDAVVQQLGNLAASYEHLASQRGGSNVHQEDDRLSHRGMVSRNPHSNQNGSIHGRSIKLEFLKLFPDHGAVQPTTTSSKSVIFAQKSSNLGVDASTFTHTKPIKALMTQVDTFTPSATNNSFERSNTIEDHDDDIESSLEAFILLQKSMLEKQWELSFNHVRTLISPEKKSMKAGITRSGISVQQRRVERRRKFTYQNASEVHMNKGKHHSSILSAEFLQNSLGNYVRGTPSEALLRHSEVVHLSRKIKVGLFWEKQKLKKASPTCVTPHRKAGGRRRPARARIRAYYSTKKHPSFEVEAF